MEEQAIKEMMSAFAAGCMDKENFIQFKDYILSGGDLPEKELGSLQNVVALIPSILELEKPDPKLKDAVAKKLISIQSEINNKIKTKTYPGIELLENQNIDIAAKEEVEEKPVEDIRPPVKEINKRDVKLPKPPRQLNEIEDQAKPKEKPLFNEPPQQIVYKNGNGKSSFTGWMAIVLAILLFTVGGYFVVKFYTSLSGEITSLKKDVATLKDNLQSTRQFVDIYASAVEFLNYPDISVVSLKSQMQEIKSWGKILVSFESNEALLQTANLPALVPNQLYQVWLVSKGQSYSIGTFLPEVGSKFVKFTNLPLIPKSDVSSYKITNELKPGAEAPAGDTYLTGNF